MKSAAHESSIVQHQQAVTGQRLLLHNLSGEQYQAVSASLRDRPALRLTYDRGNLEILTIGAPSPLMDWASTTQRLVLDMVDWQHYETLLEALEEHNLRVTYDHGSLELMTLSPEHEGYKNVFHLFIQILAEETEVVVKNLGSTTCKREELERGLEPDECFYTKNWPKIRGKTRLDLSTDPPPDLVVEVDITHSSLNRMQIYASLGVAEVWQFDGENLRIYQLGANGEYEACERSPTFPTVLPLDLARWARAGMTEDDTSLARTFRIWVREQLTKN